MSSEHFEDDCLRIFQRLRSHFVPLHCEVSEGQFCYENTIIPHDAHITGGLEKEIIGHCFLVKMDGEVIARVDLLDPNAPKIIQKALHGHVAMSGKNRELERKIMQIVKL